MKLKEISDQELEKSVSDFLAKLAKKRERHHKQLERAHSFFQENNINEFISKVIKKYESKRYKNRWLNRNIEPENSLYWFLLSYAHKYGQKCSEEEWDKYSNEFTTEMVSISNYIIMRMDGQGSCVQIFVKSTVNRAESR